MVLTRYPFIAPKPANFLATIPTKPPISHPETAWESDASRSARNQCMEINYQFNLPALVISTPLPVERENMDVPRVTKDIPTKMVTSRRRNFISAPHCARTRGGDDGNQTTSLSTLQQWFTNCFTCLDHGRYRTENKPIRLQKIFSSLSLSRYIPTVPIIASAVSANPL